tara:strand:- start:412 stop:570 length:159 start_codon:yes stop_codon:yes gene_type:complete
MTAFCSDEFRDLKNLLFTKILLPSVAAVSIEEDSTMGANNMREAKKGDSLLT